MVISSPTNPSLAAGRTRCSHLEIVSQTQMSSWMRHYPSLVVQTGRMTTVIKYAGSSTWGSRLIIIVIAITHLLAFQGLDTAIIAPGLVPFWAISIGVSPTATSAGVLMIIVAAAALGPATGISISAATVASGLSGTVAGAAARSGSVCHSVRCMLPCRFALGVSALHVNGIHGSSPFII